MAAFSQKLDGHPQLRSSRILRMVALATVLAATSPMDLASVGHHRRALIKPVGAWRSSFRKLSASFRGRPICGSTRTTAGRRALVQQSAVSTPSADFVAEPDVEKLGFTVDSAPPGKVLITQAAPGKWAAQQGILKGAELAALNGQQVAKMTKEEFMKAIASRPLRVQMTLDPRLLQQELTMTTSSTSMLRVIAPWVRGQSFDYIHTATAIYRLGVHSDDFNDRVAESPVFMALLERAKAELESLSMDARHLGNIFWSMGKLGVHAKHLAVLLPSLIKVVKQKAAELKEQHIANIFWAAAALRLDGKEIKDMLAVLCLLAQQKAPDMTPQAISNVCWATAVLRLDDKEITGMLATL